MSYCFDIVPLGPGIYRWQADLQLTGDLPTDPNDALKASILKWQTIVEWLKLHPYDAVYCGGVSTCGLCKLYFTKDCEGCPVKAKTTRPGCCGTPYWTYKADPVLRNAQAELDFLKSLL